jgi:hypothetical protein
VRTGLLVDVACLDGQGKRGGVLGVGFIGIPGGAQPLTEAV